MIPLQKLVQLDSCQGSTLLMAMYLRKSLEDLHARYNRYLHDALMPEFNITIRYAVYEYMLATELDARDERWVEGLVGHSCSSLRRFQERHLPPQLVTELRDTIARAMQSYITEDGLLQSHLDLLLEMMLSYWEIPGLDPRPPCA